MTQPDSPRHAPMKTQRQFLMNAVPYDAAPYMSASLLTRHCNIAAELQHCPGTTILQRNYNIAAELQHCWHRHRMLYICFLVSYSSCSRSEQLSDGVASTPFKTARSAWTNMDRNWLQQYPPGVPADIDPDRYASLRDIVEEACAAHGHSPAFTNMGATLSYVQLDALSRAFAAWLQKKSGLVPGDRIALMMPNILQYPIALFGALRAGMVVVNTNPLYTARELEHQLKDSGAKAVVIVENFMHVLQQVLPRTDLKKVLVTRVGDLLGIPRGFIVNFVLKYVRKQIPEWKMPGTTTFKSALGSGLGLKLEPVPLAGEDIAFLQYTAGTTRVAKAAVLTHRNMVANVLQSAAWITPSLKANEARVIVTALPLYHIFALTTNCLAFLPLGARNVLITNPRDFKAFVAELRKYKFNFISGVNTLFNALLHTPGFETVHFSALRVTS